MRTLRLAGGASVLSVTLALVVDGGAQEPAAARGEDQISLRKSVIEREFQGRKFTGEERHIGRGDSLWRILVEEKGLTGRKFHSYLVIIRGLNPQVKNLDVLRIGDRVFIPLKLEEATGTPASAAAPATKPDEVNTGRTINHRVKSGETLYRIVREQFKVTDERRVFEYVALVKDLNPSRQGSWDTLYEGETLRLPAVETAQAPGALTSARPPAAVRTGGERSVADAPSKPGVPASSGKSPAGTSVGETIAVVPPAPVPALAIPEQELRAPARSNLPLFIKIVEATGNQIQQSGEEAVVLRNGTVHFDKSAFPVIYNPALHQRVVIDPDGKIPESLKTKLNDPSIGTPVLPMGDGVSLQDAVRQLLASLGYQPLPADRPVVVQEGGIAFEAKGSWMALAPEVSNRTQEVFVINLTATPDEIPEYLREELAKQGLRMRDVVLPAGEKAPAQVKARAVQSTHTGQVRHLPQGNREIIDALLLAFGIPFGVAESISVELGDGLRIDMRSDRIFEVAGRRTALFFQSIDPEIRKGLEQSQAVRAVDLNVGALSSRDVIARLLDVLGDQAIYREHRFPAAQGSKDRLTVKAWGFHVTQKAMFVTDRQIPPALQRFFFEKGLDIVYFR